MTKNTTAGTGGPDLAGMLLIHQMFRNEFAALAREAAAARDPARGAALEDQLGLVLRTLHEHHTGEDTLIWPVVLRRAPHSAAVVNAMEAEHSGLGPLTRQAGDTSLTLAERAGTLAELSQRLNAHLDREEREALPLLERHFTAGEFAAIEKEMMTKAGKDLPVIAGCAMWHATADQRSRFLAAAPPILAIMWRLSWRRRYASRAARTYGRQAGAAQARA